ncbi:hypothetical protein [Sphingopyxis kveilinensis]|uniref:hypothetical protein n=1 Tax=Sphingopyxis kveilinensis TaxID=3114367 RepID=UPI0030CF14AC
MIDFFIWEYPSQWTDRPAQEQIDPDNCQSQAELLCRQKGRNDLFGSPPAFHRNRTDSRQRTAEITAQRLVDQI